METHSQVPTQALVFFLVATAFTTVYITQPVLPVIENEFGVNARTASLSVSMVIFGVALANLPFGMLADRYPIKPIVLTGGAVVAATSLVCAITHSIAVLIAARFIQGLFIPALTTCIAAYLAPEPARRAPQRGDGIVRLSDGGRRLRRAAPRRLDPSTAPLALRVRERV